MKRICLILGVLITHLFCFADHSGTVTTSQSELNFSTRNGYDVVSFTNQIFTEEVGAPQNQLSC
jgi:hypothetical protein